MSGHANWEYEGPDIVTLWDKEPVARQPHLCERCNEPINVGERYSSAGWREDGNFVFRKTHRWAYNYPSGCPTIGPIDRAELASDSGSDAERGDAVAAPAAGSQSGDGTAGASPKESQP